MGRRELGSTQDPDVEASSAELERLKSEQNTVQTETLAIATNKKILEEGFESEKERLEQEVEEKRIDSESKIAAYEFQRKRFEDLRDAADGMAQESKKLAAAEAQKLNKLQQDIVSAQEEFQKIKNDITLIRESVLEATHSLESHQSSIVDLSKKHSSLQESVSTSKSSLKELQGKYDELFQSHETLKTEHSGISDSLASKTESIKQIDKDIASGQQTLSELKGQLADVQKQSVEQTAAMQKEKTERDIQVGNAARLIEKAEKHISILGSLEKEFTTEHLVRVGYKKLTE